MLVGLERGREGRAGDQIILLPQVSPWPYRPVDTLVFDLDGAAALRDVLNELLGAAGHPLARPVEGPFRTAI
ncbi:hypothetical protein [Actinocorallia sp. A-T 12471]|uniref:hypothetical protein n=1 Tax=Actinocorallia sp. A-T 12471 TaxID=3089813 RepID=UPI0029D3E865|nr:hypothetical protein [Actinocorallia sp. A-T 12471]MDX6741755.1 hypothetical protein [Actinocorallia sp. A-T 12471]